MTAPAPYQSEAQMFQSSSSASTHERDRHGADAIGLMRPNWASPGRIGDLRWLGHMLVGHSPQRLGSIERIVPILDAPPTALPPSTNTPYSSCGSIFDYERTL